MQARPWLRWLWPDRLNQQLGLVVSLCLLLALGLLGGYTASEQTAIALRGFEAQAAALARNVAGASANAVLTDSLDEMEALALRTADVDEVMTLQLVSPEGRSLSHVVREAPGRLKVVFDKPDVRWPVPTVAQPQSQTDPATGQILAWHPVVASHLVAWVRVEYSASGLADMRYRIWRNTGVVAVLAICLSAALLGLFLRGPVRALNRARLFARSLPSSQGEQMPLDERSPVEVQELNASLNEASVLLRQQMLMLEDSMRQFQVHEAQLAEQNEQLGAIFALSPDGLATFNAQGQVQFANQAFLGLTGLPREQVVGCSQEALHQSLLAIAGPGSHYTDLSACFEPTALGAPASPPQTLVREGPPWRVLTLNGQRSHSASVSQVLYVCDVTTQHRLDQMKSEFLSMAAHELRTPMVSIYGFTELMLKREMAPEQRQDLLGRIYRHSQSMVAILNELLDLARIEARGGQDLSLQDHDLRTLVQAVVSDFKPPSGRTAPRVVLPDAPLPVHVDAHKLKQAVLNILSNAYKYSPDGGEVLVHGRGVPQRDGLARVGLTVRDHGLGLSSEHLARMGERFFRADKSGNIPGTGLGVSIVKELMGLMGGHMEIDSTLGEGTTVTLWLPTSRDLEGGHPGGQSEGLLLELSR